MNEYYDTDEPLSEEYLKQARLTFKHQYDVVATNSWIVENQGHKTKFKSFCLRYLKEDTDKYNHKIAVLSEELYLIYAIIDLKHTAKFYKEITNRDLLIWGLYEQDRNL